MGVGAADAKGANAFGGLAVAGGGHMGDCHNYGPFLGPLIIIGIWNPSRDYNFS